MDNELQGVDYVVIENDDRTRKESSTFWNDRNEEMDITMFKDMMRVLVRNLKRKYSWHGCRNDSFSNYGTLKRSHKENCDQSYGDTFKKQKCEREEGNLTRLKRRCSWDGNKNDTLKRRCSWTGLSSPNRSICRFR